MIYDVIGIGFGPSNIALAVAMEEGGANLNTLFLERSAEALWQEGMLLEGSDIQHHFLRDFITPVNPRSKYTFANYLHASGRFFEFLNLGRAYALRREFFNYVKWVAGHFENVRCGVDVKRLDIEEVEGALVWVVSAGDGPRYLARKLVLGTGRNLNIPPGLQEGERLIHLSRYLHTINRYDHDASIAVLGASQSAVELLLDLRQRGYRNIHSIHRSFSYRLKDTSPFSDEVYFPEFVDYYHALPHDKRAALDRQVRQTNYSCADGDVLDALYTHLYEDRLNENERVFIHRNHEIAECLTGGQLKLRLRDIYTGATKDLATDLLILATGYLDVGRDGREGLPKLLQHKGDLFKWTGGYLNVERDYRVAYQGEPSPWPDIYFNGLCESSHGMGDAGSFSLVSLRAKDILGSLLGRTDKNEGRIYDIRDSEGALRASGRARV